MDPVRFSSSELKYCFISLRSSLSKSMRYFLPLRISHRLCSCCFKQYSWSRTSPFPRPLPLISPLRSLCDRISSLMRECSMSAVSSPSKDCLLIEEGVSIIGSDLIEGCIIWWRVCGRTASTASKCSYSATKASARPRSSSPTYTDSPPTPNSSLPPKTYTSSPNAKITHPNATQKEKSSIQHPDTSADFTYGTSEPPATPVTRSPTLGIKNFTKIQWLWSTYFEMRFSFNYAEIVGFPQTHSFRTTSPPRHLQQTISISHL